MSFTGTVLALDLATTTGWAFGHPNDVPAFGHIRFSKPGSSRALTYRAFRDWLQETWNVRDHQPDLIVFESPAIPSFMGGKTNIDTTKMLFGLSEHLEEWCYDRVELREASTSQVRSHFIGRNYKSAIAKRMTMERCQQMGWKVSTPDEADACALWDYQRCFLDPLIGTYSTPLFFKG